MKTVATFLALACVVLTAHAAYSPTKPVWPTQFSALFGMYYNEGGIKIQNATSYLYYDWNIQAQTIDYVAQCVPGIAPNSQNYPCKLYFNNTGIFLSQPTNNGLDCCSLFPGVGAVPPQFLAPFKFLNNGTAPDYNGFTHECFHWIGPGIFAYWTDRTTGHDVRFKDGTSGVFWQYAPFSVGPQSPSLFQTPNTPACNVPCPAATLDGLYHVQGLHRDFLAGPRLAH
eukprot:TRINITY_DN374_c0_g1_i1.p1 TRINITY_DN374_c0_g1~~TRINITY_DN374_c0_g1_i1.p1  ORF type:complete len:227 (-),score=93.90 TRINITY_DN374_c0_g1_i1:24-704(-)